MVSKGTSLSSKLRRSKSSASVKPRRRGQSFGEPIEDEAAQQQALAAAYLAMQRAAKSSRDESHSSEIGPNHHSIPFSQSQSIKSIDTSRINPNNTRHTNSRRAASYANDASTSENDERPPTHLLPPLYGVDEFGVLSDDIPSVPSIPSSYRKLRRSKSMFSARSRPGDTSGRNRDTLGTRHFARTTLRRSMSFFRGESEQHAGKNRSANGEKAAIKLARDQFLRALSHSPQSGTTVSSYRRRRSEIKPFRKTVRPLGSATSDHSNSGAQYTDERPKDRRKKVLSESIKNGFRRLFGRRVSERDDMPSSQAESCQSNVSNPTDPQHQTDSDINSSSASHDDQQMSSAFSPHHQSKDECGASVRSMKSFDSTATSNSRVTSWTNSTATNTVTARRPVESRLFIIEEHGNAIFDEKPNHNYHDGYSAFRQPIASCSGENYVDSQRVYSALMRRIDGSDMEQNEDGTITPRPGPSIRRVPSETSLCYDQPVVIPPRRSPSVRSQRRLRRGYAGASLTPQQIAHRNESIARFHRQSALGQFNANFSDSTPRGRRISRGIKILTTPTKVKNDNSDDDTSTIMVRRTHQENSIISPSVYSRSGGTPDRCDSRSDSESGGDRGTATIITSERLPYRPRGRDRMLKGSADWKSWITSQMDLIDKPGPPESLNVQFVPERGHYRENTQIDDAASDIEDVSHSPGRDKGVLMGIPEQFLEGQQMQESEPPYLTELIPVSQNNFSRPIRCSSRTSMSLGVTNVRRPSLIEANAPACSGSAVVETGAPSQAENGTVRLGITSRTPNQFPLTYRKTRLPDLFKPQAVSPRDGVDAGSPTPVRSRHGRNLPVSLYASDIKGASRSTTIRPWNNDGLTTKENNKGMGENIPPRMNETSEGLSRLSELHSTISSKRMVDIFLSDRRRHLGSSEDSTADSAFL
ncbi:hypothetical protein LOZ57_001056 [Ophidiomyces ophidiicola]|uniref:uncharacterized protein n=1 Tax=Ophidiomyces ophidiicola TaxID=1387563 RepID=UPI0020C56B95|nr:uncharacterized protein LOZ57_001056 [Ophidiomyces ophidiicola]KAI1952972.1 hypothetical protein LOZ57_001056 [Ophidiomyces ophidiicola]